MGHINHHAIVVTGYSATFIEEAHEKASEIFGATCSEVIISPLNGYASFFIAPDGSKEGWDDSDIGDKKREEFADWLSGPGYRPDGIEINYGDDGQGIRVIGECSEDQD